MDTLGILGLEQDNTADKYTNLDHLSMLEWALKVKHPAIEMLLSHDLICAQVK